MGSRGAGSPPPRALVIAGDGLNCERETSHAFRLAGAEPEVVHITDLLDGVRGLAGFQLLAFIGGFSNGDHLGAGTVQASRLRHRLGEELARFLEEGRPAIGICNGFQTLVKLGVLPGGEGQAGGASGPEAPRWRQTAAIMANDSGRFEDRWVHLVVEPGSPCLWTRGLRRLFLPVRHGEGKFFTGRPQELEALASRGQVALRYADVAGNPTMEYPANPNGSLGAVAGVSDPSGAVLGLMPHPEAYVCPWTHPSWTRAAALGEELPAEGQGLALFRNAVRHVREAVG